MTHEQAAILLNQLGGRMFTTITGTKNFVRHEASQADQKSWLRMDLAKNKSGANRLQITLDDNDTYTMYFYKMTIVNSADSVDVKITNEQTFEGVYDDMLQSIFTDVTGMYTKL